MSYIHGLGALEEGATWQLRNGVAIPLVPAMLSYFESIQRLINAINAKEGRKLIGVDGRIGSDAVSALRVIVSKHATATWGTSEQQITQITPSFVAQNAPTIVGELLPLRERLDAPYVADPKTSSAPSVAKAGGIENPPDRPRLQLSPIAMVLAAVSLGAVVALSSKRKGRRR